MTPLLTVNACMTGSNDSGMVANSPFAACQAAVPNSTKEVTV